MAHNHKIIDIVEIDRPEKDFILFESLSSTSSKVFYIVNTEHKNEFKIGRGQDCDVRITDDISVSRTHAIMRRV